MPQLHGEDRLERADGSEAQEPADGGESSPLPPRRRCSAIARFFVSRTARSLTSGAEAWLQWHAHEGGPRHCSENDGARAARFDASASPSSTARMNVLSPFRRHYSWNLPGVEVVGAPASEGRTHKGPDGRH